MPGLLVARRRKVVERLALLIFLWLVVSGLLAGCGGKTGLKEYGTDRTAGSSASLEVDCGRSEQYTSPGRPITLDAFCSDFSVVRYAEWKLVDQPAGSETTNSPVAATSTTLVPDKTGDYVLQFAARDSYGHVATCEVTVHSIVGPPAAICPEDELVVAPNEELIVEGDGYDDVAVVGYAWSVASRPTGSTPPVLRPLDQRITRFTAATPGRYELSLTVFDGDGASGSCLAVVTVAPPLEAICPEDPIYAPTRAEQQITASVTGGAENHTTSWQLVEQPPDSNATLYPTAGLTTHLTPDRQGDYLLRFHVEDDLGQEDSCEVHVVGTPTAPTVTCPEQIETRPLVETSVSATAVDDGEIVSYQWSLVGTPPGSDARPPSPASAASTSFTPDIAGIYQLQLVVRDDDGETGSCSIDVLALATEGLRVELFWDAAPDMDLHVLHPDATHWHGDLDCHWQNCVIDAGLPWYTSSAVDNPRLDIDDVTSYGPENINIDEPVPGTYRVAIHAWYGDSQSVTVRVYCGGSATEPIATYGPVPLPYNYLWRVVDVDIVPGGCNLLDLSNSDGSPNIERYEREAEPR